MFLFILPLLQCLHGDADKGFPVIPIWRRHHIEFKNSVFYLYGTLKNDRFNLHAKFRLDGSNFRYSF